VASVTLSRRCAHHCPLRSRKMRRPALRLAPLPRIARPPIAQYNTQRVASRKRS
jgi:hypothetical protein